MTANIYYATGYKKWHARIYMGVDKFGRPKFYHVGRFVTKPQAEKACQIHLEAMRA